MGMELTLLVNTRMKVVLFSWELFSMKPKCMSITSFCKLYFHGHSVGGTNPSLLDAMAARAPLAIHNNAFNRSIIKDNAYYFQMLMKYAI